MSPKPLLKRFDQWYEDEHTPMLPEYSDWKAVRRFAGSPVIGGTNRLVLHYLATVDALESGARKAARATQKAQWFLAQDWFQNARKHVLHRRSRADRSWRGKPSKGRRR